MRALPLALLLGFGLLISVTARAQDEQPAADAASLQQRVVQLVKQLDDRQLSLRQQAEKELIELGPQVLPLLPEPNNRMPAEVRQRLLRITTALQTLAAESTTQATHVTLSGSMPLADAMQQLAEQTGNKVERFEQRDVSVEVDFQQTTYWQALDQILDQARLAIEPYGGRPNTLVLMARAEQAPSRTSVASYHEAFRVEPLRILAARDVQNPAAQGMRVAIGIAWEPRLAPITVTQDLSQVQATDNRGATIAIDTPSTVREAPVHYGMAAVELEIPLALADRGATHIASLKGNLTALVPSNQATFEFENLESARAVEQRKAGVTVIIDEVRKNVDLYQIRLRVRFDEAAGALESHRGWIFNNEAYLVDASGQRIENAGLETTRQDRNEVGVAYLFDVAQGLQGCKFIYKTPALIIRAAIPYDLKDIPLP